MADPELPYAQVVHRVLGVGADTDADADLHPDLSVLAGLTVTFTPQPPVIKWLGAGGPVTHPNKVVTGVYDSQGYLRLMQESAQEGVWLLASSHEDMVPSGWTYTAKWSLGALPPVSFAAPPGAVIDLTTVIPVPASPGSQLADWLAAVEAAQAAQAAAEAAAVEAAEAVEGVGTGGGVRSVSGTVDLGAAPGLYEVYALDAATVQGVPLVAGDAAVFRYLAGEWSWMIVGRHTSWQTEGGVVTPPGDVSVVTGPDTVVFTDVGGAASDLYTIPSLVGIAWTVAVNGGAPQATLAGTHAPEAGAQVTVTASAAAGYTIAGPSTWLHTFSTESAPAFNSQVFLDNFNRPAGKLKGTVSDSGHTWVGGDYGSDKLLGDGTAIPNGTAGQYTYIGLGLAGPTSIRAVFTIPHQPGVSSLLGMRSYATADRTNFDGVGVNIEDRGDGTGRAVLFGYGAGYTINFNQESRADYWSHISGWTPGVPHTARLDIVGGVVTAWVDDAKIIEIVAPNMASVGTALKIGATLKTDDKAPRFDKLEVWQ